MRDDHNACHNFPHFYSGSMRVYVQTQDEMITSLARWLFYAADLVDLKLVATRAEAKNKQLEVNEQLTMSDILNFHSKHICFEHFQC